MRSESDFLRGREDKKTEKGGRDNGDLSESGEQRFLALHMFAKYDKTAQTAIQQIRDRRYTQALEGYAGEILAVGINDDRDNVNKLHSCVIERLNVD